MAIISRVGTRRVLARILCVRQDPRASSCPPLQPFLKFSVAAVERRRARHKNSKAKNLSE